MKASRISLILFIALILLIGISTGLKVMNDHRTRLLKVAESKIEDAAKKCQLEGKCTTQQTTLDYLIEEKYLEPQIHPITKEFIDGSLVIECINFTCKTTLK